MNLSEEFRFNGGRLSLDLAATVRKRASQPLDVLSVKGAASRWLLEARVVPEATPLSPSQEEELKTLRESIWSVASAASEGEPLPTDAVRRLNLLAKHPLAVPQLDAHSGTANLLTDDPFNTALSTIARDAIELVASPLRARIKACGQDDCRMLFLDVSRSSRRRWCSMDRCGSRAKGEVFRQRRQAG